MPLFRVRSGSFNTTISRPDHQQAATDAIGLLKDGPNIPLGVMTVVTEEGFSEEDAFFFPTLFLTNLNGIDYRSPIEWK